jgi:hypothetical protein
MNRYSIIIIALLISYSGDFFAQTLKKEITINGIDIIESSLQYQLVKGKDTISLNISVPQYKDSTVLSSFKIYSRAFDSSARRAEIVIEYSYRNGFPLSFNSSGNTQFIILDSLSGMILFHSVNSSWYTYGTNWTQGPESCGYSYEIKFLSNGNIEIYNSKVHKGLGMMPQSGKGKIRWHRKPTPMPVFGPDKKPGVYKLNNGKYTYTD